MGGDDAGSAGAVILVSPDDAWERLQSDPGAVLVDVRSDMEYLMIGHAKGAVHVPWIDAPEWTVNPRFIADIRKVLLGRRASRQLGHGQGVDAPLFLICRSGNRSRDAAAALAEAEIVDVYIVEGGFEGPLDADHHRNTVAGWRHAGLPWEQC